MAEPGQLRLQNNRLFVVLSWWCDQVGDNEGTHWLCALLAMHNEPKLESEIKLADGHVCEAWNFMTLTDAGIENYSTLAGTLEEADRRSICEIVFSMMGSDCRSPRTKELLGPFDPAMTAQEQAAYFEEEQGQFQLIELSDKFWQDFWGVVPVNRYRKHKHRELPRVKRHIKHRRWGDEDWPGR